MGENSLMGGGMSPADVHAVVGNNDSWGGRGYGYEPQYETDLDNRTRE